MARAFGLLMLVVAVLSAEGCATLPEGYVAAPPIETPQTLAPPAGFTWYDYGRTLLAQGEAAEAERAFTRSMSREGVTPQTLSGLGIAAARQGLMTKARRELERAHVLAPENTTINNNLGVVLYALGDYYGAREAFRTAFLTSSGRSELAGVNLRKSEEAIARTSPKPVEQDPAVSHRVQRLGESEYMLMEIGPDDGEQGGTGGEASG